MTLSRMVAVVSGAGQGLGRATAMALAARGVKVGVLDMNVEQANKVVKEINDAAKDEGRALALVGDVSIEADMQKCIDATVAKFGGININVNCAGIAPPSKTLGKRGPHSLDLFAKVLTVNTLGTFNVLRLAAEAMQRNAPDAHGQRGVIVNTASVAAMDGQIGQAAYAASKGAVAAMTLPLARDLSPLGIRVCTIAPGLFMTPMLAGLPESVQKDLASTVPFPKRLGDPEEYAKLVLAIVDNPMLNGETIRLDGALRMQP